MDSGQPPCRRWRDAPSYIRPSSEELETWPRWPSGAERRMRTWRRPRMSAVADITRYEDTQPTSCVLLASSLLRKDSSCCPHDAIYRGFKCSIWSSLAIWTWLFDPAASRPQELQLQQHQATQTNPRMRVCGGVAHSVRLMPAHNHWTRLLYFLRKSDTSHIFWIVCDNRR